MATIRDYETMRERYESGGPTEADLVAVCKAQDHLASAERHVAQACGALEIAAMQLEKTGAPEVAEAFQELRTLLCTIEASWTDDAQDELDAAEADIRCCLGQDPLEYLDGE